VNLPALLQSATLLASYPSWRRHPLFLASLAVWLPVLWIPASSFNAPHFRWEQGVWLPAVLFLIPLQALAAVEAFFGFAGRFNLAPRVSIALGALAVSASLFAGYWKQADWVGQAVQVARYQRVGCCVFLLLAGGFYASVRPKELIFTREGRHLLLLAGWFLAWMLPIVGKMPGSWGEWMSDTWMVTARCGLLVVWLAATWKGAALRCPCEVPDGLSGARFGQGSSEEKRIRRSSR
jgi:hypothetical protein